MALYDWNQFGLTWFFQCIALLFVTLRVNTDLGSIASQMNDEKGEKLITLARKLRKEN